MANYSIKFGKRKIKNPFIHGKWMKRTSKLKENGI
ncbi:transposase [Enterococcus faecium]|nr:transposase [Enterococcus faecium]